MPRIELKRQYEGVVLEKILDAVRSLATSLGVPEKPISAYCELADEPGTKIQFQSLDEIDVASLARAEFYIRLGSYEDDATNITLWSNLEGPLDITVEAPFVSREKCRSALDAFAKTAGLTLLQDKNARGPQTEITLRRRFTSQDFDPGNLISLFRDHLLTLAPLVKPEASVFIREPGEREVHYRDIDQLLAELPGSFQRLEVDAHSSKTGFRWIQMYLIWKAHLSVEINLTILPDHEPRAKAALDEFANAASLEPFTEDTEVQPRRGRMGFFFTSKRMDVAWFQAFASDLGNRDGSHLGFHGHLEFWGEGGKQTFTMLPDLAAEASLRWTDLLVAYLDLYGSRNVNATIEPKLDLVVLEVQNISEKAATGELRELAKKFNLEEYSERPYGDPTASRSYSLHFNRTKFAEVVEVVVRCFTANDPVLWPRDSYVVVIDDKGNRRFNRAHRLDEFIIALKTDADIAECKIIALGPQDRMICIHAEEGLKTLRVKARLEPGSFTDLTRTLKDGLGLKAPRSSLAEGEESQSGFWRMFVHNKGFPGLIAAALVGAAVTAGGFFGSRLVAKDHIEFRHPYAIAPGKEAKVQEGCVTIQWAVIDNPLFDDKRTLLTERGELRVTPASGLAPGVFKDFRSGNGFYLPRGRWRIDIFDHKRKRASRVLPVIVTTADQNADRQKREPGPCA